MTKEEFHHEIETLLEMKSGSIKGSTKLDVIRNWDSLAIVTLIAMFDAKFGVTISPEQIGTCKTVDELFELASAPQTA